LASHGQLAPADSSHAFIFHRPVREQLGQKDIPTTMIYAAVLNKPGLGIRSPLERQEARQTPASRAVLYEKSSSISR
jgi:hypothetical protein